MGLMFPGGACAAGASKNTYAALTTGYTEGDFGTSTNRKLYSLIPEVGRVADDYDVSASIPLLNLRIEDDGQSSSESGLGDVVLRAGKRLWLDAQAQLSFSGSLAVKLPTGDDDKGLGTGATDVSANLSANKKAGAYSYTALLGYVFVGEPAGIEYDNAVLYGIGVNRSFSRTNVFASVQRQTSVVPGEDSPLNFDVGFFHLLSLDYVVIAHVYKGLSDGSPDGGIGLSLVRWF